MAQTDSRPMKAVVNSTPLIALSVLNHLLVLKALFDEIFVPSSVFEEVVLKGGNRPGSQEVAKADWIIVKEPAESFPLPPELLGLDTGEMDVILLAREVKADWVLIDEKLARRVAKGLGLKVKGTLGLLLIACRTGLVSKEEARAAVQKLASGLFRISNRLFQWFEDQLRI